MQKRDKFHYFSNLTFQIFESWVEKAMLQLVEEAEKLHRPPALLMDNASYHSRYVEKVPAKTVKKAAQHEWLKERKIEFDENWTKVSLCESEAFK